MAKSCIEKFDQIFSKKVTKKDMKKVMNLKGVDDDIFLGDTYLIWVGEHSYITLMHTKSKSLIISYETLDSEYGRILRSIDK